MNANESKAVGIVRLVTKERWKYRQLNEIGFSNQFISKTLHYFRNTQNILVPHHVGRPSKVTNPMKLFIESQTLQNTRLSIQDLRNAIKENIKTTISAGTISKIRGDLAFRYKPPKIRQELTAEQKNRRIKFAISALRSEFDLSNIIFSDEVRVCLGPDNKLLWRRYGQDSENIFEDSAKFPPSVLLFGSIGKNYKGRIIFVKGTVDSEKYVQILKESHVIADIKQLSAFEQRIFMQDGAKCHTSEHTLRYLRRRVRYINKWPPNSPDLNPIEMVWAVMKDLVKAQCPKTLEELQQAIILAWNSIGMSTINKLVDSFEYRLQLVVLKDGGSISDTLRSSIHPSMQFKSPDIPDEIDLYDEWFSGSNGAKMMKSTMKIMNQFHSVLT